MLGNDVCYVFPLSTFVLQSKNNKTPIYSTKEFHSYFESTVIIENNEFSAHGRSKRQAETNAAKEALNYLKSKND